MRQHLLKYGDLLAGGGELCYYLSECLARAARRDGIPPDS